MYCEDLNIRDCDILDIKIPGIGEIFMDVFVLYSGALQTSETSASLSQCHGVMHHQAGLLSGFRFQKQCSWANSVLGFMPL